MASAVVKREFLARYDEGRLGSTSFVILARSADEIASRYPLLTAVPASDSLVAPGVLDNWRYFPGETRPLDHAVRDRTAPERAAFRSAAKKHRENSRERARQRGLPWPRELSVLWADIDDDMEFRLQMHGYWRDDPRYRELPPERRLF